MGFDIAIKETGNGGDIVLRGADLAIVYSIENEVYLATFGGNKEQDTPAVVTQEQSFDYWANNLMYKGNSKLQFNSKTERTMGEVALNSSGRTRIEDAMKEDIKYLSDAGAVTDVKVIIKSDDWIQTKISVIMPDGSESVSVVEGRKVSDGDFFIQDFNDEYLTTPTEMDKPLLEDGKWSLKYLPGKIAGTATDMALMILTTKGIGGATGALPMVSEGVASAVGQVASGYTMSAEGYYKEAKASGMNESDANAIAREVAILDGFLELVSPNEKLLTPFKLKDDFASYAKALANGATKKKALAETTRKIIEKNIPENFQELLQSTNAHVMFTSNELSKANETARQSFGEEVVETVIMTTLLTSLMGGKDIVTTRDRYNNEALYMAAFAPEKMMSTMSKNLERGLITQEQHDALTKKITIASEALKKMGDVPQEKKIKTLPAMVEKMEEEAKKKETDAQFQAPIDEKIKTKEEEINQVLNEPSEADMLDENIAYLQELEAEGVIDDNQKELLDYLLTRKQTQNEQSQEGQVQAQEVITPVEETAPYVVDATKTIRHFLC